MTDVIVGLKQIDGEVTFFFHGVFARFDLVGNMEGENRGRPAESHGVFGRKFVGIAERASRRVKRQSMSNFLSVMSGYSRPKIWRMVACFFSSERNLNIRRYCAAKTPVRTFWARSVSIPLVSSRWVIARIFGPSGGRIERKLHDHSGRDG